MVQKQPPDGIVEKDILINAEKLTRKYQYQRLLLITANLLNE